MASNPEQFGKEMKKAIAGYISRESHRNSMITVTKVDLSTDKKYADILVTVLPTNAEAPAMEFLTRHKDDIRRAVMKYMRHRFIPYIRFHIDAGDKKRSNLQTIMQNTVYTTEPDSDEEE
ncbi:MAG: ribosome-binding factor A [Candidatus Nomurabacteria bacterium]|nr:ribosome-binding factor A [Candidatus Nomurabacteria bacterium]